MKIIVCENYEDVSKKAAEMVQNQLLEKPDSVLGFATGSTPIGMYKELVSMYQNNMIDFSKATSFNLDEYYPIEKENDQSYIYFMKSNLFDHVNFREGYANVPDGTASDAVTYAPTYDKAIEDAGGIDLQVLGIGRNGHIGFNEPDNQLYVATHVTGLTDDTIDANARFFASADDVPKQAITMGLGSIMKSKKIMLLVNGANKKEIFAQLKNGMVTTHNPASMLLLHPDVTVFIDKEAYN